MAPSKKPAQQRRPIDRDPLDGMPQLFGEEDRLERLAALVKNLQAKLWDLEEDMRLDKLGDDAPVINPQTGQPVRHRGAILTYGKRREAIEDALRDLAERHPDDMEKLKERMSQ